jgi:hypothetical protein
MANLNALASAFMGRNALAKDEQNKLAAWDKASPIEGRDPREIRIDFEGRIIRWDEYGKQSSCGWEIDHIHEVALGGSDEFSNLRARHWQSNRAAGARLGNALASANIRGQTR